MQNAFISRYLSQTALPKAKKTGYAHTVFEQRDSVISRGFARQEQNRLGLNSSNEESIKTQ